MLALARASAWRSANLKSLIPGPVLAWPSSDCFDFAAVQPPPVWLLHGPVRSRSGPQAIVRAYGT